MRCPKREIVSAFRADVAPDLSWQAVGDVLANVLTQMRIEAEQPAKCGSQASPQVRLPHVEA